MRKKILHSIWRLCQVGRDLSITIIIIAILVMMFVLYSILTRKVLLIIIIIIAFMSSYLINFLTSLFDHLADWLERRI